MNNATKILFASSAVMVQAQSPTKGINNRFPKLPISTTAAKGASTSGTIAADLDSDGFIEEVASKNNNGSGKAGAAFFQIFRYDDAFVLPLQNVAAQDNTNFTGVVKAGALSAMTAGANGNKTFYQTILPAQTTDAKWASKTQTKYNDASVANVLATNADNIANVWHACLVSKVTTTDAGGSAGDVAQLVCGNLVQAMCQETSCDANAGKYRYSGGVQHRLFYGASVTTSTNITVGGSSVASDYQTVKPVVANPDLIFGSFYQVNGSSDTVSWCQNTSPALAADKEAFSHALTTTAIALQANNGIGPKSKCTWQVTASANTAAPVFQLALTVQTTALFQVIEWYSTTALGTAAVLMDDADAAGANDSPFGSSATSYPAANGVFFAPFSNVGDIAATSLAATGWQQNTGQSMDNASEQIANSIGRAVYYDRATGQRKDTLRAVDSSWVLNVYEPYKAVSTQYTADKGTYDTAKTSYETAFTANAKDNTTTVPTRPDMPSQPPAFSGYKLLMDNQIAASGITDMTAATIIKEMALATGGTMEIPTYTQANIATHFHNRANYYQIAETGSSYTLATQQVSGAFGRLGQNNDLYTGTPFFWGTAVAAARPGMQISVLPEFVSHATTGPTAVNDWTVAANAPGVTINVKEATLATWTDYEAPAQPAAATAISVGAQALAASMAAAAAVATTMF